MGLILGVDSVMQAPRLSVTSSQRAIFLHKMSILTDTMVLDNMYTGKSVAIITLKQPTNDMTINRYLMLMHQR